MKNVLLVIVLSLFTVGCIDSKSSSKKETQETPTEVIEQPIEEDTVEEPEEIPIEEPQEIIEDVVEEPTPDPIFEEVVSDFATLSWTAPFTRVNGDKLHLYEIDYFIITHTWDETVEDVNVGDYSTDTYTFNNLPEGIHEFEIRTVDTDGLISPYSDTVIKTIPQG